MKHAQDEEQSGVVKRVIELCLNRCTDKELWSFAADEAERVHSSLLQMFGEDCPELDKTDHAAGKGALLAVFKIALACRDFNSWG